MTADVSMTGVWQGNITFQDGKVIADPATTSVLRERIEGLRTGGFRVYVDYRVGTDHVMVSEPIRPDDSNYALGFIQALERMGYDVVQRHPEVDVEIQGLIQQLPDDHPARKKLDEFLPAMTYLEKTYIRNQLRIALSSRQ